jgi:HrpA-like RNA helicase
MHRLLPKPLSDLWTGWEAAEAAVANDSEVAAAAAREEQVALVMSSLASASLKSSSNAPSQVNSPVEVAELRTEARCCSSQRTSQLIRKWESQCRTPQFAAMQQQRQALPAWSKRAEIIAAFSSSESRVFLVQASL